MNDVIEDDGKIVCQLDGARVHVISTHLKEKHPGYTIERYQAEYPDAPLYSPVALARAAELSKKKQQEAAAAAKPVPTTAVNFTAPAVGEPATAYATERRAMHEVFSIPAGTKAALTKSGNGIPCTCVTAPANLKDFVPDVDPHYIFNIELLKVELLAFETNIPSYLTGHAGTGKSSLFEQICAHTGRPMIRVQHTVNMEESNVLGQFVVKEGSTVWEDGPLPFAMRNGLVYLADEYDFGMPHVLSLYQPVLEGKALVIKEAPAHLRVVRPHPLFRFAATGNTNGSGDDTGLYQGTALQNFANYERFGIMERVDWMPKPQEVAVVSQQGGVHRDDAEKLVDFAIAVRKEFAGGQIGAPISPRALIYAAKVGLRRSNFKDGLQLSFMNRLNTVDKEACTKLAQRIFG